ncbi:hypothetical protein DAPPUDRAFT_121363 [Daphnia pulex]|uniref:Uncharacterized protein n=1 Tax=Daphnia pulex TaxID=6669 RepID=E9I328_DAPPU|nr:hypothetical protein DAPPUDRAFT_121363 [Daphnia pulex]|eukprot:EFX61602.1 hypothetical protein DAPPUDRAFT_121363 [Daphnia pulex]
MYFSAGLPSYERDITNRDWAPTLLLEKQIKTVDDRFVRSVKYAKQRGTCSMANDTSSTVFIDVDNLSERNDDLLQRIIDLERKLQVANSKFEELNSKLKEIEFKDHALAESK